MAINKQEELEKLKKLSPKSLPDNPSQSGWSTAQIKEKFYVGLEYLYELLYAERVLGENHTQEIQTAKQNLLTLQNSINQEKADRINAVNDVKTWALNNSGLAKLTDLTSKANKSEIVPIASVSSTAKISALFNNYKIDGNVTKPFIYVDSSSIYNSKVYFCVISKKNDTYNFEFEDCVDNYTYIGSEVDGDTMVSSVLSNTYKQQYARTDYLQDNYYNKTTTDAKLLAKADLENGKVPASQLPSYVDDVTIFEIGNSLDLESQVVEMFGIDFNEEYSQVSDASTLLNMFLGLSVEEISYHKTFDSFGYFFAHKGLYVDGSLMGSYNYIYHFGKQSNGKYKFEAVDNAKAKELLTSSNIFLNHGTNKQYRLVTSEEFSFGNGVLYTISLTNTSFFAEIVSTLALGETSATAFAGNRGKTLEGKVATLETQYSSIDTKISNDVDTKLLASLDGVKVKKYTRAEYDNITDTSTINADYVFVAEE